MQVKGRVCVQFYETAETGDVAAVLSFTSEDGSDILTSSPIPCNPGAGECFGPVCVDCDPEGVFYPLDSAAKASAMKAKLGVATVKSAGNAPSPTQAKKA